MKKILGLLLVFASSCSVLAADVARPFLLWNAAEIAELKERVATDPEAKIQVQRTLQQNDVKHGNRTWVNFFKYAILGDEKAGRAEKAALLKFIDKKPEPMTWNVDPKTLTWNEGMPSAGDRHQRDEQTLNVLRYDLFYNELTPEQRAGIERSFRNYIQFHLDGAPPRHPSFSYTRTGWLPNMHYPRAMGTFLMAVAMQDEEAIKQLFEAEGGLKWYFDSYLADNFYMEEFAKYYSNNGTLLLYCEALEDLGLSQYGYGYKGKTGNNVLDYMKMYFRIGYPRFTPPGGMPVYPRVSMGDAKGGSKRGDVMGTGITDHTVVTGYAADGNGGDRIWSNSHMNGPLAKAHTPIWFEILSTRFPNQGFEYFLAQMRRPGDKKYYPSMFTTLKPIDPADVEPPPAPSYLSTERGFALLRMDESPSYWEGSRPAVSQQFGMYYVHYVHDCFSILGYYALNRPIYINSWGGSAKGYAGGHPWKDSTRGHAGVVVDNQKPRPIDRGEKGLANHTNIRFQSAADFKVSGAKARGLWRGVDAERVLVLTDDYLFDVYALHSDKAHRYEWMLHGPGSHAPGAGDVWQKSTELDGGLLYVRPGTNPTGAPTSNDLQDVQKSSPAGDWSTTFIQDRYEAAAKQRFDDSWFDRGIGVRVSVLGEEGTDVFAGRPPASNKKGKSTMSEFGGFSMMIRRTAQNTQFVALHEPFEGGLEKAPATKLEKVSDENGILVVKVHHAKGLDLIALALGDAFGKEQTIHVDGVKHTFTNQLVIRSSK